MSEKNQNTIYRFYPMFVSWQAGIDDTPEIKILKWNKFNMLSDRDKDNLVDELASKTLESIEKECVLKPQNTEIIARLVRGHYLQNLSKQDIGENIQRSIPQLSRENIDKIIAKLTANIFDRTIVEKVVYGKHFIKISFKEALQKYPKIGEQLITSAPIKLEFLPTPVRPSLKNWITDYQSFSGATRHDAVERARFLFHSENAKKLTEQERKKLTLVLNSYDEELMLEIDVDSEQISFENLVTNRESERKNSDERIEKFTLQKIPTQNSMPVKNLNIRPSQIQQNTRPQAQTPIQSETKKPSPLEMAIVTKQNVNRQSNLSQSSVASSQIQNAQPQQKTYQNFSFASPDLKSLAKEDKPVRNSVFTGQSNPNIQYGVEKERNFNLGAQTFAQQNQKPEIKEEKKEDGFSFKYHQSLPVEQQKIRADVQMQKYNVVENTIDQPQQKQKLSQKYSPFRITPHGDEFNNDQQNENN